MDQPSSDSVLRLWKAVKISATILHCVAISLTVWRLGTRSKSSKLWWDDYLVIIPLVIDAYYLAALWAVPPMPDGTSIRNYWVFIGPPVPIIWLSRTVLALGHARIFPPDSYPRRVNITLTACFGGICVSAIASSIHNCVSINQGTPVRFPACIRAPISLTIFNVVGTADLTSDSLLSFLPVYIFWRAKLRRVERWTILITFACGISPGLMTVAFALFKCQHSRHAGLLFSALSHLESAMALAACNFLVVVASVLRASRRKLVNGHPIIPYPIVQQTDGILDIKAEAEGSSVRQNDASLQSQLMDTEKDSDARSTAHFTLTDILDSYIESDDVLSYPSQSESGLHGVNSSI